MRYHAHMVIESEEPLSKTPSQGTTRRKGPIDALPFTVLAAVIFTPDLTPVDTGCEGGGSYFRALDAISEFKGATDHDWRALKCARMNGMATNATFNQTIPGDP